MECVEPVKYSICLDLSNKSMDKFPAFLDFAFKINKITNRIVLNSNNLSILDVSLHDKNNKIIETKYQLKNKFLIINTKALNKGNYLLKINYLANYSRNLSGVYKANSLTDNSVTIMTHFEPNFASSCFPCLDEPCYKAIFAMSFVLDLNDKVISNTSIINEENITASLRKVSFADTYPLPTYLIAFAIGDYKVIESAKIKNTTINIYASSSQVNLGKFALNFASQCFAYLSDYFKIPYPNPQLDLVALPELPFNGMENDGAIFFREKSLLLDESQSFGAQVILVCDTISHEISHLWFGNLVSIESWSMLWLKEAMATLIQIKVVDLYFSELNRWGLFSYARLNALFIDGLKNTRPIELNKASLEKAYELFDTITYQKGSQILAWFEKFCGDNAFRKAIINFLDKYKFQSTNGINFFKEIENTCNFPVFKLIPYWINDSGYPLIDLEIINERRFKISQKLFKYNDENSEKDKIFNLPLILKIYPQDSSLKPYFLKFILENQCATFETEFDLSFVMANAYGLGFYRVNYHNNFTVDNFTNLTASEKLSILGDYYALLLAQKITFKDFIDKIHLFKYSQEECIWLYLKEIWLTLDVTLPFELHTQLIECLAKLIKENLQNYHIDLSIIFTTVANFNEQAYLLPMIDILSCIDESIIEIVKKYQDLVNLTNVMLKPSVLTICSGFGDVALFHNYYQYYLESSNPQISQLYFQALANFRISLIHNLLFDYIKTNKIKKHDIAYLLKNMLLNKYSAKNTWNFIKFNYEYLTTVISESAMANIFMGLGGLVTDLDENQYQEIELFFNEYYKNNLPLQLSQQLEKLFILLRFRLNLTLVNSFVHGT